MIFRDQSSILKFRLAPVFLSEKSSLSLSKKLNIPCPVVWAIYFFNLEILSTFRKSLTGPKMK
jgi:hypothetical protein